MEIGKYLGMYSFNEQLMELKGLSVYFLRESSYHFLRNQKVDFLKKMFIQ